MGRKKPPKDEPIDPAKRTTLKLGGALGVAAMTGGGLPLAEIPKLAAAAAGTGRVLTAAQKVMLAPKAELLGEFFDLASELVERAEHIDRGEDYEDPISAFRQRFTDVAMLGQEFQKLQNLVSAHAELGGDMETLLASPELHDAWQVHFEDSMLSLAKEERNGVNLDELRESIEKGEQTFARDLKKLAEVLGEKGLGKMKVLVQAKAREMVSNIRANPSVGLRAVTDMGDNSQREFVEIIRDFIPDEAGDVLQHIEQNVGVMKRLGELYFKDRGQYNLLQHKLSENPYASPQELIGHDLEVIERQLAADAKTGKVKKRRHADDDIDRITQCAALIAQRYPNLTIARESIDAFENATYRFDFGADRDAMVKAQEVLGIMGIHSAEEGPATHPIWGKSAHIIHTPASRFAAQRFASGSPHPFASSPCRIILASDDTESMKILRKAMVLLEHVPKDQRGVPATITEADIANIDMGEVRRIARSAGAAIIDNLKVLESQFAAGDHSSVDIKGDESPVTIADKAANQIVVEGLKKLTPNIPIMSEEDVSDEGISENLRTALNGGTYWTVDPLDGTKTAIAWASGEKTHTGFGVHIGLVQNGEPVLGAVFFPAEVDKEGNVGALYYTDEGKAYKETEEGRKPLTIAKRSKKSFADEPLRVAAAHDETKQPASIAGKPTTQHPAVGGGRIIAAAEGKADVGFIDREFSYWDVAAAHAILRAAGGDMCQLPPTPTEDKAALLNAAASADALKEGKPVRYDNALRDAKGVPYVPPCVAASNATLHTLGASEAAFPKAGRKIA